MPSAPCLFFLGFHLDLTTETLWDGPQCLPLRPKAWALLRYLVEHPQRLIPQAELLAAIWQREYVSDGLLRGAIRELRRVLHDEAVAPRCIETVSGRGYRFIAEVTALPSALSSAEAGVQGVQTTRCLLALGPTPSPQCRLTWRCHVHSARPLTPATRLFCTACGQALAWACPQCGAHNDPTARFCGGCGHAVMAPTAPDPKPRPPLPAETERRQLTVLFCDLVDSTRLARQLDPEDWRDVVRAYQQACAAVIQRFDGYIAQYLGDGLLVYFGYPQAHEDAAERAVRTGLGLVEAMGPLNTTLARDHGVRLAARVGVHTGLVVVGAMGSGDRQEHLALGATPNLAARLQGQAAPDTVVISAATHQLVQGLFTCQALDTSALKGLDQPLEVYQVLGASAASSRWEAAVATGLTPLVGGRRNWGCCAAAGRRCRKGTGR